MWPRRPSGGLLVGDACGGHSVLVPRGIGHLCVWIQEIGGGRGPPPAHKDRIHRDLVLGNFPVLTT